MNTSGILSAYSPYEASNPVYTTSQTSSVRGRQEFSDEKEQTNPSPLGEINDEAIISDEAKALLASEESGAQNNFNNQQETGDTNAQQEKPAAVTDSKKSDASGKKELDQQEKQMVAELKARDIEVKAHEQAHMGAAAGVNASAPSYDYQVGPDGKRYATGGEVSLSFTPTENATENIQKAQTLKNAALAPAQPSGQDLAVARNADKMIMEFREQAAQQKLEETEKKEETTAEKSSVENPVQSPDSNNDVKPLGTSDDGTKHIAYASKTDDIKPGIANTEDVPGSIQPLINGQESYSDKPKVNSMQDADKTKTSAITTEKQNRPDDILKGKTEILPTLSII